MCERGCGRRGEAVDGVAPDVTGGRDGASAAARRSRWAMSRSPSSRPRAPESAGALADEPRLRVWRPSSRRCRTAPRCAPTLDRPAFAAPPRTWSRSRPRRSTWSARRDERAACGSCSATTVPVLVAGRARPGRGASADWPERRWERMPDRREPRIRGRGHPLPFSKGRMATTLFLSGVEAEHAYQLALEIEETVLEVGASEISLDDLHRIVEGVLDGRDGRRRRRPLPAWQAVLRRERPLIVMHRRRHRHRQEHARHRAGLPAGHQPHHLHRRRPPGRCGRSSRPALMPSLHYSSFQAGGG